MKHTRKSIPRVIALLAATAIAGSASLQAQTTNLYGSGGGPGTTDFVTAGSAPATPNDQNVNIGAAATAVGADAGTGPAPGPILTQPGTTPGTTELFTSTQTLALNNALNNSGGVLVNTANSSGNTTVHQQTLQLDQVGFLTQAQMTTVNTATLIPLGPPVPVFGFFNNAGGFTTLSSSTTGSPALNAALNTFAGTPNGTNANAVFAALAASPADLAAFTAAQAVTQGALTPLGNVFTAGIPAPVAGTGNLTVEGQTQLNGNTTVGVPQAGAIAAVPSTLSVIGATNIGVAGNNGLFATPQTAVVPSTLNVVGNTTIGVAANAPTGQLAQASNLTVNGNAAITNGATVGVAPTANPSVVALAVTGSGVAGSNALTVSAGNTSLTTLSTSGVANLNTAVIGGGTAVSGTKLTVNGDVAVTGDTNFSTKRPTVQTVATATPIAVTVDSAGTATSTTPKNTVAIVADVVNEATARATANIVEAKTRSDADVVLQKNITSEATTRAAADTTEANTRSAADTVLQTKINNEKATRVSADNLIRHDFQTADVSLRNDYQRADQSLQNDYRAADRRINDKVDTNTRGIAMVAAMTNTTILPGNTMGMDFNMSYFEGEAGIGFGYAVRVNEHLQLNAALAATTQFDTVAARAGASVQW